MRAKDIMRRPVVNVDPDMTLGEAARLLARHRITGAPVMGAGRKLLGVLSQTDMLRRHRQQETGEVPAFYRDGERVALTAPAEEAGRVRVAEIMTPAALCADEDTPVDLLARYMLERRVHRVIITKNGAVRGIVTTMDMLRLIAAEGWGGEHESDAAAAAGPARRADKRARRRAGERAGSRGRRERQAPDAGRRRQGRARLPR